MEAAEGGWRDERKETGRGTDGGEPCLVWTTFGARDALVPSACPFTRSKRELGGQ